MRRMILAAGLVFGALSFSPNLPTAAACPMCKYANEEGDGTAGRSAVENARPKAYMYSILFMLSMPAALTSIFGLSFYRLHRKQQALAAREAE